jgi:hypothetical protein
LEVAERWNQLYQRADMNEAEQEDRIKAWLAQDGIGVARELCRMRPKPG